MNCLYLYKHDGLTSHIYFAAGEGVLATACPLLNEHRHIFEVGTYICAMYKETKCLIS